MLTVPTFQPVHAQYASEAEIFQLQVQTSRRGKEFLLSQAQYFSEAGILNLHVPTVPTFQPAHPQYNSEAEIFRLHGPQYLSVAKNFYFRMHIIVVKQGSSTCMCQE